MSGLWGEKGWRPLAMATHLQARGALFPNRTHAHVAYVLISHED